MPPTEVRVFLDGAELAVCDGDTVLGALWSAGVRVLHRTARTGEPRAFLCGIGVCFDCLVTVDGERNVRACMTRVADGMRIETQQDAGLEQHAAG